MRIISDFKDFYDGLGDGSDSRIWTRRRSVIEVDKNDPVFKCDWKHQPAVNCESWYVRRGNAYVADYDVNLSVLIFCGRLIPFWQSADRIGYTLEGFLEHYTEITGDEYKRGFLSWSRKAFRIFDFDFPLEFKTFNLKYKSPALIVARRCSDNRFEIILNSCLKDIEFQKQHDQYWTFQELERYIFNDMVEPNDPPDTISDKLKAESHGFTDKYSFRKEPKEKK